MIGFFFKFALRAALLSALLLVGFLMLACLDGGGSIRGAGRSVNHAADRLADLADAIERTVDRVRHGADRTVEAVKDARGKVRDTSALASDLVRDTAGRIANATDRAASPPGETVRGKGGAAR